MLIDMWQQGHTKPRIATLLGRPPGSVLRKIKQLRKAGWQLRSRQISQREYSRR